MEQTDKNDRYFEEVLEGLQASGNLRRLPAVEHCGKYIKSNGRTMLNLSSNDYLGLAADTALCREFVRTLPERDFLFSSSSSRLLTGNFTVYGELERMLARMYGTESALVFGSGYQMNAGILPAVADAQTLILADKLVHASLIDGIRLSAARCIRYRHGDYRQLEGLLAKYSACVPRILIVTESIFSMDGDVSRLDRLVDMKRKYPNVMLYVDEAHGVGVRGKRGLGVAEEQGCLHEVDFLCGTFGKALASAGAFVVCRSVLREFLANKMRTFIFTTALPPVNIAWTKFVLSRMEGWEDRRLRLAGLSRHLRESLGAVGGDASEGSHIVPFGVGGNRESVRLSEAMQAEGFYVLPVRPPTVPEGTSRLRFSLTASLEEKEMEALCRAVKAGQASLAVQP